MDASRPFRPVSRALEVIGERWTLPILRDLLHDVTQFNELARGPPKMSRGLLSKRLKLLMAHGIVEQLGSGTETYYRLSQAEEELGPLVIQLLRWGTRWTLDAPKPHELDPVLLMWWMRRRVLTDRLPSTRQVAQFDFDEDAERSYWLVMERSDVSVCFTPPPFEVDICVESSLEALLEVWPGSREYANAVDQGPGGQAPTRIGAKVRPEQPPVAA